jgi:hypothetical protein
LGTRQPSQFNLIFADRVPGYTRHPDGTTMSAENAMFGQFSALIAEGLGWELDVSTVFAPNAVRDIALGIMGTFHGLTILEVNHHRDLLDPAADYDRQLRFQIAAVGLPAAEPGLMARFVATESRDTPQANYS